MAYEPPPLISRESPRRRRRQRRAQQQSSCCCCAIVAVSLVIVIIAWHGPIFSVFRRDRHGPEKALAALFPLELTTDAPTYLRFNLVRLSAVCTNPQGKRVPASKPPEITVTRDGQVVTTIGDFETLTPGYNVTSQSYAACWPVPWNCPAGEYVAEARVAMGNPAGWAWETEQQRREQRRERRRQVQPDEPIQGETWCVARVRFVITGRAPNPYIPKGTCVATWEPDYADRMRRPDGRMGDWRTVFDWCEFIGADTFWFRGGVTELNNANKLTAQEPFNMANIEAVPKLAAEAHHRGLRFGTWAAAYATYPGARFNARKPAYDWAQDISRGSGAIKTLDFISLLDRRRIDHLANFFTQVQSDPNVDYVGLDYMRSDRGGYEMVDRFTSEMPLKLPKNWSSWGHTQRMAYVAMKREKEWQTDPQFYDAWNWWRAHIGAENVRDMIAKSQLKKPLWIFVLSWWHGKQHGQDPLMFTDAGVSILAPMLYQVDSRGMFDTMVRDWHEYLGAGQANICPGDQVDFHWHQNMIQPRAAPEELYDRMITAHRQYHNSGLTIGTFWHDINRASVPGNDGPYPGTEWALAGGAAFSTVRMDWRVYPLIATLELPQSAPLNTTVQGQLTLQNVVKKGVDRITLQLEKTEGVEEVSLAKEVRTIGGGQTLIVPVSVRLKSGHGDRANRLMVCVRLRWQEADYPDPVRNDLPRMMLVMDYIRGK